METLFLGFIMLVLIWATMRAGVEIVEEFFK